MKYFLVFPAIALLTCTSSLALHAELKLPSIVSDHIVLQQNSPTRSGVGTRPARGATEGVIILALVEDSPHKRFNS
jgi:hypothetical protein